MLDLFLKLIDRLIDLKRLRGRRDAKTFDTMVQPVFADLTRIHQTYLEAFTNCLDALRRPESTTAEVARDLLAEGIKCEAQRRRVVVLAGELETRCEPAEMRRFFASVRAYFFRSGVRLGTHFSETLALTERGSKPIVVEAVEATLEHIRTHWESVCRDYAETARVFVRSDG